MAPVLRFFSLPTVCKALTVVLLALGLYAAGRAQWKDCDVPREGFLRRICFGETFFKRALPEVKAVHPPVPALTGFDAQFYAQIAVDPTLQHPQMKKAMDGAKYRCRRILLPFIAYVAGLGRPAWILHAYSVLNMIAWFALVVLSLRWARGQDHRVVPWCVGALCLSLGAAISIRVAVLDLPVAVWIAGALLCARSGNGLATALCITLGALTRETAIAALPMLLVIPGTWRKRAAWIAIALIPPAAWWFYVEQTFGGKNPGLGQSSFGFPGKAMFEHLGMRAAAWSVAFLTMDLRMLCIAVSLSTQGIWFLVRRQYRDPLWVCGAAFAAVFFALGDEIWKNGGGAPSRVCLPLVVAFHFSLMREKPSVRNALWFLLANCYMPFVFRLF